MFLKCLFFPLVLICFCFFMFISFLDISIRNDLPFSTIFKIQPDCVSLWFISLIVNISNCYHHHYYCIPLLQQHVHIYTSTQLLYVHTNVCMFIRNSKKILQSFSCIYIYTILNISQQISHLY